MKCKHCGKHYPANIGQPAPGGSSAPGLFFYSALVLFVVSLVMFVIDISIWKWVVLGLALFVAIRVPFAWSDCQGAAGLSDSGGEKCPHCGEVNHVWPWSF